MLQTRCLLRSEVQDLIEELKREGSSEVVTQIVLQLMGLGFTAEIAQWAAAQAEGPTIEDRVNAALSMLG